MRLEGTAKKKKSMESKVWKSEGVFGRRVIQKWRRTHARERKLDENDLEAASNEFEEVDDR